MSKLIYPNNGIYRYSRSNIESCTNNLTQAIANSNFDVPASFTYKSYLDNLSNVIRNYHREINSINSKLQRTNNSFDELSNNLEIGVKKMETVKINERDRMII